MIPTTIAIRIHAAAGNFLLKIRMLPMFCSLVAPDALNVQRGRRPENARLRRALGRRTSETRIAALTAGGGRETRRRPLPGSRSNGQCRPVPDLHEWELPGAEWAEVPFPNEDSSRRATGQLH